MLFVAAKFLIVCYSSRKKLISTILWEIKYKVPCIAEQLLNMCWGKGKDGEAMKELGSGKVVYVYFLSSFRSRVLEQENLTLALNNLIISISVIFCITDK